MEQTTETLVDKKDIENAAPSWSGYVYQGKVAIYTALHILNKLIEIDEGLISEYSLVIENLEDFVIYRSGLAESIHQVKAKPQKKTIGSYNEANLILLGKLALYPYINEAILHTATELKEYSEEQLKKNIENLNIEGKNKRLKIYKDKLFEDNHNTYLDVRQKLRIANDSNNNCIEGVIELDQIKHVLQEEIKKFYEKMQYPDLSKVQDNIEYVYANFLFLIEDLVHISHLTREDIVIDFTKLKNILENESIFNYTTETVAVILLQSMSSTYDDFIDDFDIEELIQMKYSIKWKEHLDALRGFEKKDFYVLCTRLTPHKVFSSYDKVKIQDIREIIESTGLKDVFFRALLEADERIKVPTGLKNAYVLHEDGQFHSLTTLLDHKKTFKKIGEKIFKNIESNAELFYLLFDIDVFITGSLNDEYQGTITNVKTDATSSIIKGNDNRETIVEPKTIRFIDIDTFIGDVDNDSTN